MNKAVCYSHIGKRPSHEDNFLFTGEYLTAELQKRMVEYRIVHINAESTRRICLYAICDGMGGHKAGEVASRMCVERLAQLENEIQHCTDIKDAVALIQPAIARINADVCRAGRAQDDLRGMGTTLVLLVVQDDEYAILNVGDSRAYHYNGTSLTQITKDHTEGQRMLDLGILTRKELADFPARKNLSRYIGYGPEGLVLSADAYFPPFRGGLLMLCSDGISDALSVRRIETILSSGQDLIHTGNLLVDEAAAVKNADNATVLLFSLDR